MTATYEQEQKDLQARVIVLRETLSKAKAQRLNIDSFLAQAKKYTEVKELDAEIIRALVERIDVFKPEKRAGYQNEKSRPFSFIELHWSSRTAPRNRKNRHSRISPNYADIFQGIKSPLVDPL